MDKRKREYIIDAIRDGHVEDAIIVLEQEILTEEDVNTLYDALFDSDLEPELKEYIALKIEQKKFRLPFE